LLARAGVAIFDRSSRILNSVHWNLGPSSKFSLIVPFRTFLARNTKQRDHILRILPPPAPAFGTSRATQAPRIPRPDVLGTPRAVLRRPGRPRPDPGTRPGRARFQPHQPVAGGRADPARPLHHRRRPLRPARQQAHPRGTAQLPPLLRARTGTP